MPPPTMANATANAGPPIVLHACDLQRPAATGSAVRGVGVARDVFVNTAHEPAKVLARLLV